MHVISRKRLLEAAEKDSSLSEALDTWNRIAKRASWQSLVDVRSVFPTADGVGRYTVFNIKGNRYRMICEINYRTGRVFIRYALPHAEYDTGGWRP